jgi:RND family efflux transporter MFP subunit
MAVICHRRLLSIAFVLSVFAFAGCGGTESTEKPKSAPKVTVAHPGVRELTDEDDYNGWLTAYATVEVRSRVRGHIQSIHFKDGDIVKKGQLLFQLDPRPFQVEIDQARANARALDAQKIAAKKDLARYTELIKSGAASRQELDKAQADADAYDARIAAQLEQVKRYELDLEYSKIRADLTGKIGKANLTEGNLVNAGGSDPLLTTIVSIDPIYVDFNVDERAMQNYQKAGLGGTGNDAQLSLRQREIRFWFGLDTEEGFKHEGHLVFADNKYAEGTGTILVRGIAKNPDGILIPGSRVRVRIPVSDKYRATLVPDTAVNTDQDQKYLLIVGDDKIVKRQNVRLGRLLDDGMRVITEPKLKANEWIITEGMELARPNYAVEPVPESAPAETPSAK